MLDWSDSLSVHVEEIDAQHKSLVGMVNRLYDAMTANHSKQALTEIVNDMREYSEVHFATEEQYMDRCNYPDRDAHKSEHRDFIAKAAEVERDYRQGKISLSMDVLNFLSNWLVTHINDTDKKLGEFLSTQGLD